MIIAKEIPSAEQVQLSPQTVEYLHRQLSGDPRIEGMVLKFIADRYGAKDLLHLSPTVAKEILRRPADFIRTVKHYYEPELGF